MTLSKIKSVNGVPVEMSDAEYTQALSDEAERITEGNIRRERKANNIYRRARGIAYREQLGKEGTYSTTNCTIGDVLDVIITQLIDIVPVATRTPEFNELVAKIETIKIAHPKP